MIVLDTLNIINYLGRQVHISCGFDKTLVGRIKAVEEASSEDTDSSETKDSFVFIEKTASNGAKVEILVNISKIEEVSGIPEDCQDDRTECI